MRVVVVTTLAAVASFLSVGSQAANVLLRTDGTSPFARVDGDKDDDWWIQASTDLATWIALTNWGTWLSGNETNAPWRSIDTSGSSPQFFRALKTGGLYDPALFRTVSLTFTQANWGTLLASARTANTNIYCSMLTLNNGATNIAVGARYKGNTSYSMAGTKKSINLDFDYVTTNADLMGYKTVNLNNAAGDESIMREALYFTIMSKYTPCPEGAMCRVHINGSLWGVYSLVEQENADLIKKYFPSSEGDRWRAPNAATGGTGGPGGGGGFVSSNSAFYYFGNTSISSYTRHYEMKSDNATTNVAFGRLINAILVLNTTPAAQLRDKVEDVFAVDDWLWFLALENVFVDDDSYWNKGADYGFYYAPEDGRIYPVEHDGNEAFASAGTINTNLSPVTGATGNNRPLLYRLLPNSELRQRYLAHMRTVLDEYFSPTVATPMINEFQNLSVTSIVADPNRGFTLGAYTNEVRILKSYVTNRHHYLRNHAELTPLQPNIGVVNGPTNRVTATDTPFVTVNVTENGTSGLGSVWLYHRGKSIGRFAVAQMFDDGAHGDGVAGDGVFGAAATNYPAGTKVRYYIEARAANAAQAARFSPARAERETYSYRVSLTTASNSSVVINEFMASNTNTLADPQGEYDDWIELRNVTGEEVDLSGRYLSDEPSNPRKWQFPAGTKIPADGYLIVWADEDSSATGTTTGLHASFRLSASGDELYLTDTDANLNAVLDSILFGDQTTDRSYGRSGADADVWIIMDPTPGLENK
jgi:spore coat protein CotH